jgi:cytochrome c-type biogenesis protein CcmH/NrfG
MGDVHVLEKIAAAVCIVVALASAFPAVVEAQGGNQLRGKLTMPTGRAASQIIVVAETGTGSLVGQVVTNNEGDFQFSGLSSGSYLVIVQEPGFEPVRERVDFTVEPGADVPGETQYVHIALVAKPGPRIPGAATVFVQQVPPAASAAYERGSQLSKDGKDAEAIAAFREAVAAFPDYFDANFALASELSKTGKSDEAIKALDSAQKVNPKDDRVYALFGVVLLQQKKYSVAAAVFGEAARLRPAEPQYPLYRASALIDQASVLDASKPDQAKARTEILALAETDLTHAYELSGKGLAAVHLQRARLYERRGDKAAAAGALEAYLKQTPNAPNAAAIRESIKKLREK